MPAPERQPALSLQLLLMQLRIDVLEFELQQLQTVAKGLVEAAPPDRAKWWGQLKILAREDQ